MPSRQFDDEQVIKLVKEGDTEAFGALYEQYAEVIFRMSILTLTTGWTQKT
jgi:hypothetical protein